MRLWDSWGGVVSVVLGFTGRIGTSTPCKEAAVADAVVWAMLRHRSIRTYSPVSLPSSRYNGCAHTGQTHYLGIYTASTRLSWRGSLGGLT